MPVYQICGMLTVLSLYLLRGLTRSSSRFLLEGTQITMFGAVAAICATHGLDYAVVSAGVSGWPFDIREALNYFNLHPDAVEFAVCKKCDALYPPDPRHRAFSERCVRYGCGGILFHRVVDALDQLRTPVLSYNYQSPISWIGRLLSRRSIVQSLITAPLPQINPADIVYDFWGAKAVRELLDKDGRSPFFPLEPRVGELRLAFGLFVDWFSPFATRSSRHYSVGAIYLVCMNLPPEIRYKLENICLVGAIPGPKEPRLQNLHHFLSPLVDDLLRMWSPGIVLSRTVFHVEVLVRAALLPLIADSPAMRKAIGLKSSSSKIAPCSICGITSGQLTNFSWWTWPRRSWQYHLEHAHIWLNAPDQPSRDKLAEVSGIRWSELLRLPYWDPTRYAVVDAMHNLFLGDLKRHLEFAWGMLFKTKRKTSASPDSDVESDGDSDLDQAAKVQPSQGKLHTPDVQRSRIEKSARALRDRDERALKKTRLDYITALALANGVDAKGTIKEIAEALLVWVSDLIMFHCLLRITNTRPLLVFTGRRDPGPSTSCVPRQAFCPRPWFFHSFTRRS